MNINFDPNKSDWQMPETDWGASCNDHLPTLNYGKTIHFIFKQLQPQKVLEIGSAWAVSAMAILMSGPEVTLDSVDSDATAHAKDEAEVNGFQDRLFFHNSTSDVYFENLLQNTPSVRFDAVYVDGSHLYQNIKPDIEHAWHFTKPGGFIVIDDYCHEKNRLTDDNLKFSEYGVSLALCQFIRDHKITKLYPVGELLVIFKHQEAHEQN